jgi:pimeloyl-ACP methyl ester carboxylesterase
VLVIGKLTQTLLDPAHSPWDVAPVSGDKPPKYFDIVGFDPRGVGSTMPVISCFPDNLLRNLWYIQSQDDGVLGSSDTAYGLAWARASTVGQSCSQFHGILGSLQNEVASFVNTSPVVADMVAIIERHGEWREAQAKAWLADLRRRDRSATDAEYTREAVLERTRWREGREKLLYWGFSYGTALGATFASMEPHRINRVVLDGVVDVEDYYRTGWSTNLQDADLLLDKFFEYCYEAGPLRCPFHTGKSPRDIQDRYDQLLEAIRKRPFSVHDSGVLGPGIITYSDVKRLVFKSLYRPIGLYPHMAKVLADLSNGNGTSFSACVANRHQSANLSRSRGSESPPVFCEIPAGNHDATLAILCSDGESLGHETPDSYKFYWERLQRQSKVLGNEWAAIRLGCVAWEVRPKWRYAGGPFHFLLLVSIKFPSLNRRS